MQIAISNLPFMGFRDLELIELARQNSYDLEIFYEFGTNDYWDALLKPLASTDCKLSVHAPCISVNLADHDNKNWFKIYKDTILFAQKYQAEFVVVHTNEGSQGDKVHLRRLIEERLLQIVTFAQTQGVQLLIENVGLVSKDNLIYDFQDYCELLERFPTCNVLIDTGHAHVNGWDIPLVLEKLAPRIKALHLHDNDGSGDTHLCIGDGNICWTDCFTAIQKHTPAAKLILEYSHINAQEIPKHINNLRNKCNNHIAI